MRLAYLLVVLFCKKAESNSDGEKDETNFHLNIKYFVNLWSDYPVWMALVGIFMIFWLIAFLMCCIVCFCCRCDSGKEKRRSKTKSDSEEKEDESDLLKKKSEPDHFASIGQSEDVYQQPSSPMAPEPTFDDLVVTERNEQAPTDGRSEKSRSRERKRPYARAVHGMRRPEHQNYHIE
ncbi:unnamed protein product [Caenorhabditis auriculariae]|uniref:Uncharacterized protein n=1 Tax=Caenorhabditis auriculariae TaxID=2777116 RepID=A0A8S1GVW9_9PELO|nr:unnamed protein product [Caenorhabditis auriculariae]